MTPARKKPVPPKTKPSSKPASIPKKAAKGIYQVNALCVPFREMHKRVIDGTETTWNKVIESDFLKTIAAFDAGLPRTEQQYPIGTGSTELKAALQNGKGDWFNDILAELLMRCAKVQLFVRRSVPGLIVPNNNLDGAYPPGPAEIGFLLEAKMMGPPKHAASPTQKAAGRPGSADTGKRVKELAFKAIDLKGEASRRLAMLGKQGGSEGAGGGDLTSWLRKHPPRIFFFMAVRVIDARDLKATIAWADAAAQIVDAVGLYCYTRDPLDPSNYRAAVVPQAYALDRVLWRACQELQGLAAVRPIAIDAPPGPAVLAQQIQLVDPENTEEEESS
jgi:hypothetical protein